MSFIGENKMNSNQSKTSCKWGFTLIELLVVVLIIGILAAVALPQYQKAVDKSRMVQALILVKSIYNAQQVYHLANASYTEELEALDVSLPNCSKESSSIEENNDTATFYSCENGWSIKIHNAALDTASVYVHLPNAWLPENTKAAIEFYLKLNISLCYANSDRFRKACQGIGATIKYNDTGNFWKFP